MSDEIDYSNLPDFPKRVPEKLKTIRKRLSLSPVQIAHVSAQRAGRKSCGMRMTKATYLLAFCGPMRASREIP